MATYKVFNTPLETALRVALLLSVVPEDLDATSIQAIDFLATYGKAFSLSTHNANGDNRFMYCELAARKGLVDRGLRMLVKRLRSSFCKRRGVLVSAFLKRAGVRLLN